MSGAYLLLDRSRDSGARPDNQVHIWATGVMVPEALRASEELRLDGVFASVWNCLSPDLVFRNWHRWSGRGTAPVVSVLDGHPSALAWVGAMLGVRGRPLGVTDYGQSGTPGELYRAFGIDAEGIASAVFQALEG